MVAMRIVTRKWMLAAVLVALGAVSVPALASRTTYTRRFENRTSVAVAFYRAVDGAWAYEFTAYPGIPVVQREVPKRTGGRDIFGADIGPGIPGLTPGGPDIPTCGTGGCPKKDRDIIKVLLSRT